jgi:hypothetical protein
MPAACSLFDAFVVAVDDDGGPEGAIQDVYHLYPSDQPILPRRSASTHPHHRLDGPIPLNEWSEDDLGAGGASWSKYVLFTSWPEPGALQSAAACY